MLLLAIQAYLLIIAGLCVFKKYNSLTIHLFLCLSYLLVATIQLNIPTPYHLNTVCASLNGVCSVLWGCSLYLNYMSRENFDPRWD